MQCALEKEEEEINNSRSWKIQQFHIIRYIPGRIENRNSNRDLHMNVHHNSIFHNSQKAETTHVPIN